MVFLLQRCSLVLTDSGGLQKEAYFFKKPCVTLRDETEWVELVEQGYNMLAGSKKERIIDTVAKMRKATVTHVNDLYGSGHACERIVDCLKFDA
jgi:UDP-GlcNAc3NAcA epimerase